MWGRHCGTVHLPEYVLARINHRSLVIECFSFCTISLNTLLCTEGHCYMTNMLRSCPSLSYRGSSMVSCEDCTVFKSMHIVWRVMSANRVTKNSVRVCSTTRCIVLPSKICLLIHVFWKFLRQFISFKYFPFFRLIPRNSVKFTLACIGWNMVYCVQRQIESKTLVWNLLLVQLCQVAGMTRKVRIEHRSMYMTLIIWI